MNPVKIIRSSNKNDQRYPARPFRVLLPRSESAAHSLIHRLVLHLTLYEMYHVTPVIPCIPGISYCSRILHCDLYWRVITDKSKHLDFPMTVVFYSGFIWRSFAFWSSFYSKLLIRKDFAFGRILHSGEFCIRASLHSGEFCIWVSFAFWRVLHLGEFCIRASFAFGGVLHSGEFCILANFTFGGRVLHSGEFCIWTCFVFGRVLHSGEFCIEYTIFPCEP